MPTATITQIAQALGISRMAANKRKKAHRWQPVNETGVDRFDIEQIGLEPKQVKAVERYLTTEIAVKNVNMAVATAAAAPVETHCNASLPSAEEADTLPPADAAALVKMGINPLHPETNKMIQAGRAARRQKELDDGERRRMKELSLARFNQLPPERQAAGNARYELIKSAKAFCVAAGVHPGNEQWLKRFSTAYMDFIKQVLSADGGQGSFSRLSGGVIILALIVWASIIVAGKLSIPDIPFYWLVLVLGLYRTVY